MSKPISATLWTRREERMQALIEKKYSDNLGEALTPREQRELTLIFRWRNETVPGTLRAAGLLGGR